MNNLGLFYALIMRPAFAWIIISFVIVAFSYAAEKPRVITLEGEVLEGEIESISANGLVNIKDQDFPLDGLRSIIPGKRSETADLSEGKVILICGSEFSASGIRLLDEEVVFLSS